jgi:hypothetical protein
MSKTFGSDEIVDLLDAELERLEMLVSSLDAIASLATPSTGWTVRQSLAHMSCYYPADEVERQVSRLERLSRGIPRSSLPDFDLDAANAERIAALDHLSTDEVVKRIRDGRQEIRRAMLTMDDEFLAMSLSGFAPDEPQTVGALLLQSTVLHDREHLDDIYEAVSRAGVTVPR